VTNEPPHQPTSNGLAQQRTDLADERTELAVLRTTLAEDRTLMAWIRTATSLISFGFTIYKGFEFMAERSGHTAHLMTPRAVALVMMSLGVGALLIATVQYRRQMKTIAQRFPQYGPYPSSLSATIAGIIAGLGILGLVLVALRK
jgi:putative membrane protein